MNAIHRIYLRISLTRTFIFKLFQLYSKLVCSPACAVQQDHRLADVKQTRDLLWWKGHDRIAIEGLFGKTWRASWEVTLATGESWTSCIFALRRSIISSLTSPFQHLGQRRARFTVRHSEKNGIIDGYFYIYRFFFFYIYVYHREEDALISR